MATQGQAIRIRPQSRFRAALPVELAFLADHGVPPATLRLASGLAAATGTSPERALIATGLLDQDTYYRALARECDLPFLSGDLAASDAARFPESILAGILPLADPARQERFALAPEGEALSRLLQRRVAPGPGLAVTTPARLREAVFRARGAAIAEHAAEDLPRHRPDLSYRDRRDGAPLVAFGLAGAMLALCGAVLPAILPLGTALILSPLFLLMVVIRLGAVGERIPVEPARPPPRQASRTLPVYTVIAPLYREPEIVPRLVAALKALDYPAPKLDIKLVIEAEDRDTAEALAQIELPGFMEVIVAPPGQPRTKPRALNVALPLARGAFTVIYDAEDVPDPGQLRLAVSTFARMAPDVACLQARLVIDNGHDSRLARLFTIEYAALFDVINPALARYDLPVPLGGTSNHFRTAVLQRLHGWDAWNVTEDADLGIRLARMGLRVADLPSATLEEAPSTLGAWLHQRSRWMKGFMQTSITHGRHPIQVLRRLGPFRFAGAVTLTFGTVLAALGYPILSVIAVADLWSGGLMRAETSGEVLVSAVSLILLVAGLAAMVAPPIAGLRRRGFTDLLPDVALLPLYYGLVSLAAWIGLFELVRDPFRWNKTRHGLSRTSRAGLALGGSGEESGLMPLSPEGPTGIPEGMRPRPAGQGSGTYRPGIWGRIASRVRARLPP